MRSKLCFTLLLALVSLQTSVGCGSGDCAHSCLTPTVGIVLDVASAAGGAAPSGVVATLSGPAMVQLACQPARSVTICTWSGGGPLIEGMYSLLVTAPGFESKTVSATISIMPSQCNCTSAKLQPPGVILVPSGAT